MSKFHFLKYFYLCHRCRYLFLQCCIDHLVFKVRYLSHYQNQKVLVIKVRLIKYHFLGYRCKVVSS